jgi:anti-sigma-K factor RskA
LILWGQGNFLQQQSADLRSQLDAIRKRADELRGQSSGFGEQMAILDRELTKLRDKDELAQARIAVLSSLLADSPKAVAVSVWESDKQKGVLVVENLAPLPTGKDYQLWVVDPAYPDPVDAGVFSVDDKGRVRFEFSPKSRVAAADKFAVSLERKGGVKKAEGPIVLLSN